MGIKDIKVALLYTHGQEEHVLVLGHVAVNLLNLLFHMISCEISYFKLS
jgi:hypothetical protein